MAIAKVWEQAQKPAPYFVDMDELIDYLKGYLVTGDLVLIKGSAVNGMNRILDAF